jgi:UDP:flavonoid glycosyltransferase YjiC (YdhE family)
MRVDAARLIMQTLRPNQSQYTGECPMSRFLFCTVPAIGHVTPGLPIARALVARGHEVRWYTGRSFKIRVEATGARFEPIRRGLDPGDTPLTEAIPEAAGKTGLAAVKAGAKYAFIAPAPEQLADLRSILADFPADALVSDTAFVGSLFAYELGGPPRAVFGILPLLVPSKDTAPFGLGLAPSARPFAQWRNRTLQWPFDHLLFRDVNIFYDRVRAQVDLPKSSHGLFNDAISPHLYLQGTIPSFEYPRSDLPPQVHFIGAFLPDKNSDFIPPAWWGELELKQRPVVHVTQGTEHTDPSHLIVPTIHALAGEDLLVVATTGGLPVDAVNIAPMPDNVRLEPFIPHAHLLPYVDVMVTNGGYGGTQIALAHGIPLVAAGRTEEKPEVCARIAWSGAGINLKSDRPKPEQVLKAVRTLLSQSRYKERAQRLSAEYHQYNAAQEAAQLLEQLATTQQPVTRQTAPGADGLSSSSAD